jgi:hypothetical protein
VAFWVQDWQPGYLSLKICSLVQGAPCTLQLTVNIGKCNCEGLHISECKLQHVLSSQVFDHSMSCANTSVIPPCTNKVIHKCVYSFQDVPSYWNVQIWSIIELNPYFQRQNYKLEIKRASSDHGIKEVHTMKIDPIELVAWWNILWTYSIRCTNTMS